MQLTPHLDKYPNADLLWCQEEPLNNGAWTYVGPRLLTAANETEHHKGKYPKYAGRDPTSSVATGSKVRYSRAACFPHTSDSILFRPSTRRRSRASWLRLSMSDGEQTFAAVTLFSYALSQRVIPAIGPSVVMYIVLHTNPQ